VAATPAPGSGNLEAWPDHGPNVRPEATPAASAPASRGPARVLQPSDLGIGILFDRLGEAVIVADDQGRIALLNKSAQTLFGWPLEEARGMPLENLMPERMRQAHRQGIARYRATGHGTYIDTEALLQLPALRRDGTEFLIEMTLSPLEVPLGRFAVAVIRDASDRARLAEARSEAERHAAEVERLTRDERFRAELINMAAHELKTPLTPIRLQIESLRDSGLTPRQEKGFAILDRNFQRLERLIHEILEVSRSQTGRLRIQTTALNLDDVVRDVAATFQPSLAARRVALEVEAGSGAVVLADRDRLEQVLFNLLENAARHSADGGRVVLAVRVEGPEAVVRVRDHGRGLDPGEIGALFQPFVSLDPGTRGSGLGLYISKNIIELHRGRIWAQSEGRGKGSTFAFALPLLPGSPRPAAGGRGPGGPAGGPAAGPPEDSFHDRIRRLV
jgi:PAS domain S-box-containing protein